MIYTFELNDQEVEKAETFAKECDLTVSEFARICLFDAVDLAHEAEEAWEEYLKDPVTYTLEEIERERAANAI